MKRPPANAFTLIELLVVVAIIVALLAILMPAMSKSIEISYRVVCGSNQRQMSLAALNYASSNFGQFPDSDGFTRCWWWDVPIKTRDFMIESGATRDVFYCPSIAEMNTEEAWAFNSPPITISSFAWLIRESTKTCYAGPLLPPNETLVSVAQAQGLRDPVMFADSVFMWNGSWFFYGGFSQQHRPAHLDFVDPTLPAGGNVTRIDGSVIWTDFDDMTLRTTGQLHYW